MNYLQNLNKEVAYLKQFYTESQIDTYAKGSVEKVKKLYNITQPKKVKIGTLKNKVKSRAFMVTSPDGLVPVLDCIEKIKSILFKIYFSTGEEIVASHDHLYQLSSLQWIYARELKQGDVVLHQFGTSTVESIEKIEEKTKVYDLAVDHPNHRYYTNGICSHNSGKSLFMQNLAVNWTQQKLNGVYITLELSEDLCSMRIDSMMTDTPSKEIFKDIDNLEMKVKMVSKKSGKLRIKYVPAQSTVNDIRSYIKELQIQTGVRVDFVCIDYLDLLMPVSAKVSPSDLFVKDKYVSEEIRNLAKELNVIMVTASQLNRCLSLDTKVISNGKEIEIKDINVGDWLESNEGPVQVYEKLPITRQAVYKIKTKSGKEIICSGNHKFPTNNGLQTINSGLQVGDYLRSVLNNSNSNSGKQNDNK